MTQGRQDRRFCHNFKVCYKQGGTFMRLRQVLGATVLLLGMSVGAHAATLATGAVYAGVTQTSAACWIFNAGTTSITFVSAEIVRDDGGSVGLSFNDCNALLPPGRTCSMAATIANNH